MNSNINEEIKLERKNRRAYLFSLVGVLTLLVVVIGTTYAFFQLTATNNSISGSAYEAGLDLQISPVTSNSNGLVPQNGSYINESVNLGCNDGSNTVCHLYKLNLLNPNSSPITISGTIAFNGIENMPNLKWSTGTLTISESVITGANFATEGTTASANAVSLGDPITIASGSSSAVYLAIWIEETGVLQEDSGIFTATVTYTSSDGQGITSTITALD